MSLAGIFIIIASVLLMIVFIMIARDLLYLFFEFCKHKNLNYIYEIYKKRKCYKLWSIIGSIAFTIFFILGLLQRIGILKLTANVFVR